MISMSIATISDSYTVSFLSQALYYTFLSTQTTFPFLIVKMTLFKGILQASVSKLAKDPMILASGVTNFPQDRSQVDDYRDSGCKGKIQGP